VNTNDRCRIFVHSACDRSKILLAQALERSEARTEATEALRGLIGVIVLMPDLGAL